MVSQPNVIVPQSLPMPESIIATNCNLEKFKASLKQFQLTWQSVKPCVTFLANACALNNSKALKIVKYLVEVIEVAADADGNSALLNACIGGYLPTVKYLIESAGVIPTHPSNLPLLMAIKNGHLVVVNYLLKLRFDGRDGNDDVFVDPSLPDNAPLRTAVNGNAGKMDAGIRISLVTLLLQYAQVDPNAVGEFDTRLSYAEVQQITALLKNGM